MGPANELLARELLTSILPYDPFVGLSLSTAHTWTAPRPITLDRTPARASLPAVTSPPVVPSSSSRAPTAPSPRSRPPVAAAAAATETEEEEDDEEDTSITKDNKRKRPATDAGASRARPRRPLPQPPPPLPSSSSSSSSSLSSLSDSTSPPPSRTAAAATATKKASRSSRPRRRARQGKVIHANKTKGRTGYHAPAGTRYLCDQPGVKDPSSLCVIIKQKTQDMCAHLRQAHGFAAGASYDLSGMGPFTATDCRARRPGRVGGYVFSREEDERRVQRALERRRQKLEEKTGNDSGEGEDEEDDGEDEDEDEEDEGDKGDEDEE